MKQRRAWLVTVTIGLALCGAGGAELCAEQQYVRNRQLIDALMRDDTRTALALVNARADPDTQADRFSADSLTRRLRRIVSRASAPIVDCPTALLLACGDSAQLQRNAEVDAARTAQQVTLVQAMLAHGANPGARDWLGRSALLTAAAHNCLHVADLLVQRGMNVNARDGLDKTPLHYAAMNRNEALLLLLTHGADPNAQDGNGYTALHYAVGFRCEASTVQMLLQHGANPGSGERRGVIPLIAAQRLKRADLVRLLRQNR